MEERKTRMVAKMLGKPLITRTIREFKDPMFQYKLIRIKMMISYHSCVKDVSIKELFLENILNSYSALYGQPLNTQESIVRLQKEKN